MARALKILGSGPGHASAAHNTQLLQVQKNLWSIK